MHAGNIITIPVSATMWVNIMRYVIKETSTGLYKSCAALASFSCTFYLILFEAVDFEMIAEKVWFDFDRRFGQTD